MKHYKNIIPAMVVMFTLATFASFASAQSTTTIDASADASVKVRTEQRRMEVQQKAKDMKVRASSTPMGATSTRGVGIEKACEAMVKRVDARLAHFGEKYDKHVAAYEAHQEKLLLISAKLEAEGVVTTKLKADLVILDGKLAKFEADHLKVKAALEEVRDYSCESVGKEFKAAVQALRAAQKVVADDARDINNFIRTTLKQDVTDLRASFKAQANI